MKPDLLIEDWSSPYLNESDETVPNALVEAKDEGKGALYITGIFMQAEKRNRNGRVYPRNVLSEAVDKYVREQVNSKQSLGELNHPKRPYVDPAHAAIMIEKLWWEGDNVMGRARIIEGDGGAGDKTAALIRAGWIPGVSTRGLGVLKENSNGDKVVQEGFKLTVGVDVVHTPSASDAYTRPVQESTNKASIVENTKPNVKKHDAIFEQLAESFENEL